jgi:hypothetical protein
MMNRWFITGETGPMKAGMVQRFWPRGPGVVKSSGFGTLL